MLVLSSSRSRQGHLIIPQSLEKQLFLCSSALFLNWSTTNDIVRRIAILCCKQSSGSLKYKIWEEYFVEIHLGMDAVVQNISPMYPGTATLPF